MPEGAFEQIALMVIQAGLTLSRAETIAYACSLIDVVVQLGRVGGERRIIDIRSYNEGLSDRHRPGGSAT